MIADRQIEKNHIKSGLLKISIKEQSTIKIGQIKTETNVWDMQEGVELNYQINT